MSLRCQPLLSPNDMLEYGRRRHFITLVAGSAAAWPLAARAQQSGQMRRIGVLLGSNESNLYEGAPKEAFVRSLQKIGMDRRHQCDD